MVFQKDRKVFCRHSMKPIIEIKNLSKKYRIGIRQPYYSLRDTLMGIVKDPFAGLKIKKTGKNGLAVDEFWAVKDISLDIMPGEVIGIIGRNGAGKTTLLKLLSQITPPTAGEIILRGRVASLLEVGTGFHPELTGRENIYLNGAILGMKQLEIKRRFDEIVDFAEIEKFLDTPVKRYSSGMYMRLAFSVAAHLITEILLVDEVLSIGDVEFQKKCLGKMNEFINKERAILLVSHNMSAIARICTKVMMVDKGNIAMVGKPEEVIRYNLHESAYLPDIQKWNNDNAWGSPEIRLISVKLLKDNKPISVVETTDRLQVSIKYLLKEPKLKFRCTISLYFQGVCAFTSFEPTESIKKKKGVYESIVEITPNLLSEGTYIIGVSVITSRGTLHHYIKVKDALIFEVIDSVKGNSARGDYVQNIIGVLRPKLNWQMKYVSNHDE